MRPAAAIALAAAIAVTAAGATSSHRDAALFTATDANGRAAWCTDGTAQGTIRVWDFLYARQHRLCGLVPLPRGYVYGAEGELWRVDGTRRTALDVPRLRGLKFDVLTRIGRLTYLTVDEQGRAGLQLWRTDGTPAGTFRLTHGDSRDQPLAGWFARAGVVLYFDGPGPNTLWRTDGSRHGTWIVDHRYPHGLVAVGRMLIFTSGNEIWRSDGTRRGTMRVTTVPAADTFNAGPGGLVAWRRYVLFWTLRVGQFVLWRTDGTSRGTVRLKAFADEGPEDDVYVVGGHPVISAADGIWTTDGTPAGTVRVSQAVSFPYSFLALGGTIVFRAGHRVAGKPQAELWRTDLTRAGTRLVHRLGVDFPYTKSDMTVAGKTLYVSISDARHGLELWKSDGTTSGTRFVKDIRPGPAGSDILFDHGGAP